MIPQSAVPILRNMKTPTELWEWVHRVRHAEMMSGNSLDEHLANLKVAHLLKSNISVLCVGVGTGGWIRELHDKLAGRKEIYATDISEEAMRRISDIAKPSRLNELPKNHFDLALSYWVSQHMTDAQLEEQIRAIIPSLVTKGVFAMHYNEPLPCKHWDEAGFVIDGGGLIQAITSGVFCRSRETLIKMVDGAGGKIVDWPWRLDPWKYDEIQTTAHIMRRDA